MKTQLMNVPLQIGSYGAALDTVTRAFQNLPQGTQLPEEVVLRLYDVLNVRNRWRPGSDPGHDHVWLKWLAIGAAVVAIVGIVVASGGTAAAPLAAGAGACAGAGAGAGVGTGTSVSMAAAVVGIAAYFPTPTTY